MAIASCPHKGSRREIPPPHLTPLAQRARKAQTPGPNRDRSLPATGGAAPRAPQAPSSTPLRPGSAQGGAGPSEGFRRYSLKIDHLRGQPATKNTACHGGDRAEEVPVSTGVGLGQPPSGMHPAAATRVARIACARSIVPERRRGPGRACRQRLSSPCSMGLTLARPRARRNQTSGRAESVPATSPSYSQPTQNHIRAPTSASASPLCSFSTKGLPPELVSAESDSQQPLHETEVRHPTASTDYQGSRACELWEGNESSAY